MVHSRLKKLQVRGMGNDIFKTLHKRSNEVTRPWQVMNNTENGLKTPSSGTVLLGIRTLSQYSYDDQDMQIQPPDLARLHSAT